MRVGFELTIDLFWFRDGALFTLISFSRKDGPEQVESSYSGIQGKIAQLDVI